MQEALDEFGEHSRDYERALDRYYECMRFEGMLADGRASHSAAWDEKLWLLYNEIQAAWERLFRGLKVPPRPTCGGRSCEIRSRIFSTKATAMVFSKKLSEAFRDAGIDLGDDETFACSVCVVKKPRYVSDALVLDPLDLGGHGAPRINYVLEPTIMDAVLETIERDTIAYPTDPKN